MAARRVTRRGMTGRWAAGIILAGVVLRFLNLGGRSYSFDEALGIFRALQPDLSSIVNAPPLVEFPFFHVILHYWIALGAGEAWVRALPALFQAAALVLAWGVLKRLLPDPAAKASLALFALAPFQVLLAQDARPYGLVIAAQMGAFLVLLGSIEKPRWWKWAAWSVLLAAAGLAHLAAALWIPAQLLFVLLFRPARRVLNPAFCWAAVAAVPVLLAAYWMRDAIAHVNASGLSRVNPGTFVTGILQTFGLSPYVPSPLYWPGMAAFAGLGLLGGGVLLRAKGRGGFSAGGAALAACGLFPLLALLLANWAGILYVPKLRYAAVAQIFLLAACASGAVFPRGRIVRSALLACLLLFESACLLRYYGGAPPTLDLPPYKKPLRAAAELIAGNRRPGDAVLSVDLFTHLPLKLYLRGDLPLDYALADPFFLDRELKVLGYPRSVAQVAADAQRVWVVCAPFLQSAGTGVPAWIKSALAGSAVLRREWMLPGIRVQLWEGARP